MCYSSSSEKYYGTPCILENISRHICSICYTCPQTNCPTYHEYYPSSPIDKHIDSEVANTRKNHHHNKSDDIPTSKPHPSREPPPCNSHQILPTRSICVCLTKRNSICIYESSCNHPYYKNSANTTKDRHYYIRFERRSMRDFCSNGTYAHDEHDNK